MRTMLVGAVMLLACLSGAAWADEASAVKAVEKLGGKVTRDDKLPGKPVIALSMWGTPAHIISDDTLKPVKALTKLRVLDLNGTAVTAKGLAELKDLTNLQSLNLHRATKITDAALKEIKQFKNLQDLNLGFTGWQQDTIGNAG